MTFIFIVQSQVNDEAQRDANRLQHVNHVMKRLSQETAGTLRVFHEQNTRREPPSKPQPISLVFSLDLPAPPIVKKKRQLPKREASPILSSGESDAPSRYTDLSERHPRTFDVEFARLYRADQAVQRAKEKTVTLLVSSCMTASRLSPLASCLTEPRATVSVSPAVARPGVPPGGQRADGVHEQEAEGVAAATAGPGIISAAASAPRGPPGLQGHRRPEQQRWCQGESGWGFQDAWEGLRATRAGPWTLCPRYRELDKKAASHVGAASGDGPGGGGGRGGEERHALAEPLAGPLSDLPAPSTWCPWRDHKQRECVIGRKVRCLGRSLREIRPVGSRRPTNAPGELVRAEEHDPEERRGECLGDDWQPGEFLKRSVVDPR
jgi:hypothetical protein